jgi:ribosomal protein S18 acetylase RimI-like enzyme
MTTFIREAKRNDITLVTSIIRTAFREAADRLGLVPDQIGKHAANITESWVTDDIARGVRYFILEADKTPAGAVTVEHARPEVCYIGRLSVLPEFRGLGLGHELLAFAIDEAASTGADHISIGVISSEAHLVLWYGRMGFEVSRRVKFDHLPFEVVLMTMELKKENKE